MVNQVLFAEQFEVHREEKEWAYIRTLDIGYEGWVQKGQFQMLSEDDVKDISREDFHIVDVAGATAFSSRKNVDLIVGTKIPKRLLQQQYLNFPYKVEGDLREPGTADFESSFQKLVAYYDNSPYLWGGRTHVGIDCSGLSQAIYTHLGITLPRDAYQQAEKGKIVDALSAIKPGDLAFFDNEQGRITHVGIMLNPDTIFHASANVRIDKMDAEGIFNEEQNAYTHKLHIIKRFL